MEYSFGPSAATPSADPGPVHVFGFFQISNSSLHTITFLDMCQKTVSTHAPQFRSNLSIALKLSPIMIANIQIDLCFHADDALNPYLALQTKTINISAFFSAGISLVASSCLPLSSRSHLLRCHFQDCKQSISEVRGHLQSTPKNCSI